MRITLEKLEVGYPSRRLIQPFDMDLSSGGLHFIIGSNGVGKSTLLRTIAGLHEPISGRVLVEGSSVHAMPLRKRAELLYYLSGRQASRGRLTMSEFLRIGAGAGTTLRGQGRYVIERISAAAETVGVADLLGSNIQHLSDGEFQKMMIALVLLREPQVLLLDEPLSHLDPPSQEEMLQLFLGLANDRIVLIGSHQLSAVRAHASSVYLLNSSQEFKALDMDEVERKDDLISRYR